MYKRDLSHGVYVCNSPTFDVTPCCNWWLAGREIKRPCVGGTAPKAVKIFINKPNLSFENCSKKATEQFTLTAEQVTGGEQLDLDFTQFQNVRVVSIFVDNNQGGGDVTNVSRIVINGAPVHTTNMSELKKC
jgi:hypothetical protein